MNQHILLGVTAALFVNAACNFQSNSQPEDAGGECAEEFVSATIQAPAGNVLEVCMPLDPEHHLQVGFDDPSCTLTSAGAISQRDSSSVLSLNFGASSDWFSSEHVVHPFSISYGAATINECGTPPAGAPAPCTYNNHVDCSIRVTHAAHAVGEYAEGELTEPCVLNGADGQTSTPPTITRLHFRAMLVAMPHQLTPGPDGAVCTYPTDAGVTSP
ncbi:MAG: hypothetical protein IPK60_21690 [Sandaracinaceae bacterium]|nr:hypothetical protein [Sandaracinaceae bacterium]